MTAAEPSAGALTSEERATLPPEQRRRFIKAADAALRVRRLILLLAAHAAGHMHHPHVHDSCETCKERWPCVTVLRAAGPALDAIADLPSTGLAAEVDAAWRVKIEALADEFDYKNGDFPEAGIRLRALVTESQEAGRNG